MIANPLFHPLTLPNGTVLKNRIAKAAMEENLATTEHAPGERLWRMYRSWAEGGAGLIVTGNVMVDASAMTGPGGVIVENRRHITALRTWAAAGRAHGAQFWMQINHPGRQMRANLGRPALAPSAVPLELGKFSKMFALPREMTAGDIQNILTRYVETAAIAEEAGFTGVEIHAAHGYLLSQFLSPLTNRRTDQWGGSLESRARLLVEIVKGVRQRVSPGFCVAVKINSADFQRGGFDNDDAVRVVEWLNDLAVDLVEVSGGSYESPAMQGRTGDDRTLAREAYFLEFAKKIRSVARMPVMLTGGIRRKPVAERAINEGIAVVGMATALALRPDLPDAWHRGHPVEVVSPRVNWKSKPLASLAVRSVIDAQMQRMSRGKTPSWWVSPALALIQAQVRTARRTRQYVAWAETQARRGEPS
ncbi:NADH:flavin oxidoreductase/NADH oxidase family protein [Sinorhizobium sp. NFACC03]|uniref:NADH:flavin oxidoreductase/NADH oxidase family protein n=1 Tax=Sinorhizobium sp. NFACC03 TaxID=1566295 RepID=UPI0008800F9F|nr:NADH:flavin oxidoreductase/NADH oxidase family protein [Sinorhizobium sp. NFACC03]SDA93810.1 2,4-dienoyl-CoA reductase [Sinorhizobium sp. NFACC03]